MNEKLMQQYQVDFPHLFEPLRIRGKELKNRIVHAPTLYPMAVDSNEYMTERGMHMYGEMAEGGTAVITLGEAKLDELNSKAHHVHFECRDPKAIFQYHFFTEYLHSFGTLASMELNHDGQFAMPQFNPQHLGPMGASDFTLPSGIHVREMNEDDMEQVADSYAQAAVIAKRSGFDAVLLHFAHGWLMGGFLSPIVNHRTDKYNGSHENRMRFPLMVARRVRQAVGDDMIIKVRLSGDEYTEGGIRIEDAVEYAKILDSDGSIDLLHMSCGTRMNGDTRAVMIPSQYVEHGHNAKFSDAVKKAGVKIPVGVVGAINDPYKAEEILASGKADYVVMAKQLMADPAWANKTKHGHTDDIRPCRQCLHCMDTHRVNKGSAVLDDWNATLFVGCDINPTFGHRALLTEIPAPQHSKKVAVVGGGPAGMAAAVEASRRGHQVDLYESRAQLGGLMNIFTKGVWFKERDKVYRDYLVHQVEKSNVKVLLNTTATPESLYEKSYDAVLVAIGGKIYQPKFEGAELIKSRNVMGIYGNEESLGKQVVIIGAGLSGCEAAIHLGHLGIRVTLLTPESSVIPTVQMSLRNHTVQHLDKDENISYYESRTIERLAAEGVYAVNEQGNKEFYPADTVIYATGMEEKQTEADLYIGSAVDVIKIGDCKTIGTIGTAVHNGFDAAASLVY